MTSVSRFQVLTVIKREQVSTHIVDHMGFWIFAMVVVIVVGLVIVWFITRRTGKNQLDGYRAGRTPNEIELESLEEGRRKHTRHERKYRWRPFSVSNSTELTYSWFSISAPPYDVKELSAEDLTAAPPPTYEEAMGKPTSSSNRILSSPPPEAANFYKVTNEIPWSLSRGIWLKYFLAIHPSVNHLPVVTLLLQVFHTLDDPGNPVDCCALQKIVFSIPHTSKFR